MYRLTPFICFMLAAGCFAGCSQKAPTADASEAKATAAQNALGDAYKGPPTPCDKELSVKDAADLINVPVSINHYSMSASTPGEGCELGAGKSFSAMIDIAIKKGGAPYYTLLTQMKTKSKPVPGVGEGAVSTGTIDSNIPGGKEIDVFAHKGEWVCIADLIHKPGAGEHLLVSTSDDDNARKLGALCAKLFAARP
jgi:hypothetical protein